MSDSAVDVTERLFAEFEQVHTLPVITTVVLRCYRELADAPAGALPELVERLARQRLTTTSTAGEMGSPAGHSDSGG